MENVDISAGSDITDLLQHIQTFYEFPQLARYSLCIIRQNTSCDKSNWFEYVEKILKSNGCEVLVQFLLEGQFPSDNCDEEVVGAAGKAEEEVNNVSVDILKCLTQIAVHPDASVVLSAFIGDLLEFVFSLLSAAAGRSGDRPEDEYLEESSRGIPGKFCLPCASAVLDLIQAIIRHHPQNCFCLLDLAPPFDDRVSALLDLSVGIRMKEIASRCLDILSYIAADKIIIERMRRRTIAKVLMGLLNYAADVHLSDEEDDVQQIPLNGGGNFVEMQCSMLTVSKSLLNEIKSKFSGDLLRRTMELLLLLSGSVVFKNILRELGGVDTLLLVAKQIIHENNFRVYGKLLVALVDDEFALLLRELDEEVRQSKLPSIHSIELALSKVLAFGMHEASVFSE
uniref:Uncharacterized protein n=1 Tax=Leptocylindrus danicus TaxID=163516 RepID=A0A7S2KYR9_9STRA|mmetsp:Transcript_29052/g.42674  ORF Transcript_29052/g.42674 Transcript_29052/m.42674 type:complete len:397 (+) Transcript_29052:158-1348(+)